MKKIGVFIVGLYSLFATCNIVLAKDYEYKNVDIFADIKVDGTIEVKEMFTTNFLERRHGIIRIIPLNYAVEGEKFHINISNVYVEGSKFTTSKKNGNIEIKIGDLDKTLIGEQIYPISYSTYGLIRNFSGMGYAELYWNLVGYDFDTNINSLRAEINLPKENYFTSDDFLITTNGNKTSVSDFDGKVDFSEGDKITIIYNKPLSPKEGITLAIKFPNDYFEFDNDKQVSLLGPVKDDKSPFDGLSGLAKLLICVVGILILSFGIRYISSLLSKKITPVKIGLDYESKYPIIVQYSPPKGMNSAEAGLLFNCRVDPVDMTSLFYKWKNDKIIVINYVKKSPSSNDIERVIITRLKDIPDECQLYEKDFFYSIFRKHITIILDKKTKLNFLSSLYALEDYGINKKWLCRRKKTSFLGYFLLIVLILCLIPLYYYFGWIGVLIWFFVVPIIYGTSIKNDYRIKLTDEGAKMVSHIIGYAKFIKECDVDKLKLFLEEDPLYVDKILPYAVAFGLETEFLKKVTPLMKGLEKSWLSGDLINLSSMISFMKTSVTFVHPKSSSIIPLSLLSGILSGVSTDSGGGFSSGSSFGGGFSRGGGGGGGGSRSW